MNYSGYNDYEQRTAGFGDNSRNTLKTVQAWKTKKNHLAKAQGDIVNNLEKARTGKIGRFDSQLDTALSYAPQRAAAAPKEAFDFGDFIDVINPLQHLPIVGTVYRGVTGDQAHPMAQIVGGAIYGGPIGAVTGTMNAISTVQTGKDMGGHMLDFAGLKTEFKSENSYQNVAEKYQKINLDYLPPREKITSFSLNS